MVRSHTLGHIRQKGYGSKQLHSHEENPSLPNVFATELKMTQKSKSSLELKNSKVQFSDNFPDIAKRQDSPRNADDEGHHHNDDKRVKGGTSGIYIKTNSIGYHRRNSTSGSRDIAVLRKYPSMLFPKMNVLSESYDPLAPVEDVIEAGKQELRDDAKDESKDTFKEPGGSKKDVLSITIKTKSNTQASKSEKTKKNTEQDFEDKKEQQIKMIERLSCSLPQRLAETARSQLRQMTNFDVIYEMKKKLLSEHREMLQEDRKKDERWQHLERSLSETHGIGKSWKKAQKAHSKKLWMQI